MGCEVTLTDGRSAQLVTQANVDGNPPSAPSGLAANALTISANSLLASSLVLKAAAGNLYGFNVVAGAVPGYLMIYDAVAAPGDGVTTPKYAIPVGATSGVDRSFIIPLRFATGIVMVFSSTGPLIKTASATAFLAGEVV